MATDTDNLPESLKCPVCFELPEDKVFQCTEGHIICEHCYIQVTDCPQCRKQYEKDPIRNRPMEVMLENLKVTGTSGFRRQKDICKYFCQKGCSFMVNDKNADDVLRHLETAHKYSIITNVHPNHWKRFGPFDNFGKSFYSGKANESIWSLVLTKKPKSSYALIWEMKYIPEDKAIHFMCHFLRNAGYHTKQPPNVKVTISGSEGPNSLKFVFTSPANDFLDNNEMWCRMVIPAKTLVDKYDIYSSFSVTYDVQ